MSSMINIPLDMIYANPNNPRKDFSPEGLAELAASIRSVGVLQPVVVVVAEAEKLDFTYRLIAGERRWRAAREAGLAAIPAVVKYGLTKEQELEAMVAENIERQSLNPIEEAHGFKLLLDAGLKQEELAERLGKSQSHIANRLRLLELPESVQENISRGIIGPGHAKELLTAKKLMFGQEIMERVGGSVVSKGLPVREIAKEIAVQSEEVAAQRAAEAERRRLQEEELARQEAIREPGFIWNDVMLFEQGEDTICEEFRFLTKCDTCEYKKIYLFRKSQGQGCVWNDVMLLDDVNDEPEITTKTSEIVNDEKLNYQEDWDSSRPLPDHPDCAECNIGQAYLIDPKDGETQTLRCTEIECWELKMQEQEPVYTMSNTFLYTAKCPENCEHVVTVMDQGQPFKVCSNGECEFNKPENESTSINDQSQWSAILNTVDTHVNCPNGCKYNTLIKRPGIESKRCVNPEFSSIAFNPDIAGEPNPDVEEKWQTCRGVFGIVEHIPKVENNLLEVNKPSGDFLEQRKSRMPKDLNTHFDCPENFKFKIKVEDRYKITGFNHRCTNHEFIDNFCTQDGEFNQDSHEAWKACRGVFEETTVPKSNVLPVKENPQFEPKSTHNTHENCPDECMFRIPAGNGIKRDRCGNGEFGTPCKNWAEFEENSKMFRACRGFSAPEVKEEPETAVSEDAEQVSPSDKTCHHVDSDGRVLFVTYSTLGGYRTFFEKDSKLACVRSTSMPYVDSREEAEANLMSYAEKRGWEKVGEVSEQIENQGNGIYLPGLEDKHPMDVIMMSTVDKLLQFPLDSDEYRFQLRTASEKELDMVLFRDYRENGKFRIQAEKDRRLLEQLNNQLTDTGTRDTGKGSELPCNNS